MSTLTSRLFAIFAVFAIPLLTLSQTADEIIRKHIDAHGGKKAWDKVDAIRVTGKFTAFSLENDYLAFKTKGGSYYGDLWLGEKHVYEAYRDGEGWTIDPWQEMDYARLLNGGELNVMMQKADFITPFLDYEDKGCMVEYPGLDTIDGTLVHVLKLTRTDGRTETWYLDANTFLEYKCESNWVDFARSMPGQTYFDDFREVDGLVFPFFVERTFWQRDRILLVDDVEINPEIDFSVFDMPRRKEMERLAFLEGDWDVSLEVMTRRGTWYPMGNTSSSFSFPSLNLLQEAITYDRIYRTSRIRHFSYNEATGYLVSEYNDLTTALTMMEGTLTDTAFVFEETDSEIVDPETESIQLTRFVIGPLEGDDFVMERLISMDDGATWMARDRFKYTRREE